MGTEKKIAQFIPTYIKYLTHCANRQHLIDFVEMRRRKNVFLLREFLCSSCESSVGEEEIDRIENWCLKNNLPLIGFCLLVFERSPKK